MRNLFTKASIIAGSLISAAQVYAAPALSVRIMQPKSPTNQSSLKLTVVTLDRLGRAVTVKCFKKGPADAGFTQFGADLVLAAGGNSVNCETSSSVLTTNGTYQFFATATADPDTETSPTITVDYNTSGPGTPTNYSKEQPSSCTYKIKVKTADDAGKTVRVDLYRSDTTSFSADVSHRVDQRFVGSNTDVEILNTVGDCSKTYYFALRAFDSAENGSGVVGDSIVTVITTTTSTTTTTTTSTTGAVQGAIAVPGTAGNVLGEQTEGQATEGTTEAQGSTLGEATPSAEEQVYTGQKSGLAALLTVKNLLFAAAIGIAILILTWLLRKKEPVA